MEPILCSKGSLQFISFILSHGKLGKFQEIIRPFMTENSDEISQKFRELEISRKLPPYVLIGLHTCGDLAKMVLDLFLESQDASAVIDVGCCYYTQITEAGKMQLMDASTFPLSESLRNSGIELTSSAIKLGTYSPYQYEILPSGDPTVSGLTLHFRAVAEIVLIRIFPKRNYRIKKINLNCYQSWEMYLSQLVKKLNVRDDTTQEWHPVSMEIDQRLREEFFSAWEKYGNLGNRITVWIVLQMLVAPVYEAIILYDRALYLSQHEGIEAKLVPLFRPDISPRNVAVVGLRNSKK
eukprot:TRINITY_DN8016_c0_g1_i3.p1 TRINITY_DN8016_c0_g1~~TRINITY_DN8016_c0_g1_i3.p1  ORF type:complete len:295 (-),score=105.64 TRINITY_DN8016_c0_g1_i3:18-902(-)